jgi:hypothetical protein
MPPRSSGQRHGSGAPESLEKAEREKKLPVKWRLRTFLALLFFDSISSAILLTPLIPRYVVNGITPGIKAKNSKALSLYAD